MQKISVITVNYNNAAGLEATMQSVLAQNYANVEYIVVDGGSTDGSLGVIQKHASKLAYWVSEKDKGTYNAMNKGIAKATGNYCLFLNSGDFLYNNQVLSTVFSQAQQADIVYGNMLIDWGNGNKQIGKMPATITFEHMYNDTLWHPVSFINRQLFEKFGTYNESYKIVADYDFFFNMLVVKGVQLKYVDTVISVYHVDGISSKAENKPLEQAERQRVHQTHLPPMLFDLAERTCVSKSDNDSFFSKIKRRFNA